jgi:hypothetical protein
VGEACFEGRPESSCNLAPHVKSPVVARFRVWFSLSLAVGVAVVALRSPSKQTSLRRPRWLLVHSTYSLPSSTRISPARFISKCTLNLHEFQSVHFKNCHCWLVLSANFHSSVMGVPVTFSLPLLPRCEIRTLNLPYFRTQLLHSSSSPIDLGHSAYSFQQLCTYCMYSHTQY